MYHTDSTATVAIAATIVGPHTPQMPHPPHTPQSIAVGRITGFIIPPFYLRRCSKFPKHRIFQKPFNCTPAPEYHDFSRTLHAAGIQVCFCYHQTINLLPYHHPRPLTNSHTCKHSRVRTGTERRFI